MANIKSQKKFFYIYKTTNLINEKYYIGMHCTNKLDDDYLGSGTYLWRSIAKYGKENFKKEILEYCDDQQKLKEREKEVVGKELLNDPLCMNLQLGGGGGFSSEEHQQKCAKIGHEKFLQKLKEDSDFREKYSKMSTERNLKRKTKGFAGVRFKWENQVLTESQIKQRSDRSKGEKNSQFGTMWITNGIDKKKIKKEETIPLGFYKGRK